MAAIGIAVSDAELARAHFRQACFDLCNGEYLLNSRQAGAKALAVAQFQQCCEKALKAVLLLEVGRVTYGQSIKPSHRIWSVDLKDGRLTQARRIIEKKLVLKSGRNISIDSFLLTLEEYAPRMSWHSENTEYPWVDSTGTVFSPAEYFEDRMVQVLKFSHMSRLLLRQIKVSYSPQFNEVWSEVEVMIS